MWYSQLREPIFPQTAYQFLERSFGDTERPIEVSTILDLIGERSDWSPLNSASRKILAIHLLPLLAAVTEARDWNHMDPHNLAVCFAPSLMSGTDPIEEAKMIPIISRILRFAIENWNRGLSASCGIEKWKFEESLRVPEAIEDREDALDVSNSTIVMPGAQVEGIALLDNEVDEDTEEDRPPLPPRVTTAIGNTDTFNSSSPLRRKPAPSVQAPPRYSTLIHQSPGGLDDLPLYEQSVQDVQPPGEALSQTIVLQRPQSSNIVPRKPIPNSHASTG